MRMIEAEGFRILRTRILAPIAASHADFPDEEITAFLATTGILYTGQLMVAGRAVNGWEPKTTPATIATEAGLTEFADNLAKSAGTEECPMRWVSESWHSREHYNTATSAFWRVIRSVVCRLKIADTDRPDWPSHLVWTNLYKVAPGAGGNPNARLRRIQFEGCVELFRIELTDYKPTRLLLLTGMDWARPFLDSLNAKVILLPNYTLVKGMGNLNLSDSQAVKFVIASHPQGKPEKQWVEEVIRAFDPSMEVA